jgi:hypothetical protein
LKHRCARRRYSSALLLDALIGLFPVVGDIITTTLSLFIVHEAYQLGAPGHVIARMLGNVALDGVFGAVPLVGDAFDVLWRANRRNVRLLREWLEHERRANVVLSNSPEIDLS